MLICKWPENNFYHFKLLGPLTKTLIKNMEFNSHSWYACYVPGTMPETLKLIKYGTFTPSAKSLLG